MIIPIALVMLSLFLLIKGADKFVEHAASLAKKLGVSDFIIGLTLISVGTSLPELAASVSASLLKIDGIIIGNVVGSNIANVALILGISALIGTVKISKVSFNRDGYLMIFSTACMFFFTIDNKITLFESIFLVVNFIVYMIYLIKSDEKNKFKFRDYLTYFFDFNLIKILSAEKQKSEKKENVGILLILKELFLSLFFLGLLIYGSDLLVNNAIFLAKGLGIRESIIGITIIAIGTSLPEVIVSVKGMQKGYSGMVIGNVVGSNIANIFLVLGVSGIIHEITISEYFVSNMIPLLLFFTFGAISIIRKNFTLKKKEGYFLIASYIAFLTFSIMTGANK